MPRARSPAATLLAALCVAGSLPATTSGASDSTGETYRAYAMIRERLTTCSLERSWHHLSAEQRRGCKRLRRLYVLWSGPGESYHYHVHCRTSKCPATPEGEPDARSPVPSGATTFR